MALGQKAEFEKNRLIALGGFKKIRIFP